MFLIKGMPKDASLELGGLRSPKVMEHVFSECRSEEGPAEMRAAVAKTSVRFEVEEFVRELEGVFPNLAAPKKEVSDLEPSRGSSSSRSRRSKVCWRRRRSYLSSPTPWF